MITDILKFVVEVAVISFIAYYITNKFYKKISIVDSLFIGVVLSCVLTVIEKCFLNLTESYEEDDIEDDEEDEEDEEDASEDEKWESFAEVEPENKVVVKVDPKGIIKSSETRPVSTEQVRGRLSMQEQKIVDDPSRSRSL